MDIVDIIMDEADNSKFMMEWMKWNSLLDRVTLHFSFSVRLGDFKFKGI